MKTYIISYKTGFHIGTYRLTVSLDDIKTSKDLAKSIMDALENTLNTDYVTIIGLWEITL